MFNVFHDHPYIILILLSIIFYIITCSIIFYKNIKYNKKAIKNTPISKEDFIKNFITYLDKYYIKNLFFTISCVLFYFLSNLGWVLYLRIKAMKALTIENTSENKTLFPPLQTDYININFFNILTLTFYLILLLITIISFKLLLNTLFYDEVIKLNLYLSNWDKHKFYFMFKNLHFRVFLFIHDSFGKIYLFVYNVCNLQPLSELVNRTDYQEFNLYDDIYENEHVQKLSVFFVNLVKKHMIFLWLFKLLRFIIKYCYSHLTFFESFRPYIPYLILIPIMFYDFLHMKLYYTFYAFFPLYVITINSKYKKFREKKDEAFDHALSKYFYDNPLNYAKQRILLKDHMNHYINLLLNSEPNRNLFFNSARQSTDLIKYVINDFDKTTDEDYNSHLHGKYITNMYRQHFVIYVLLMSICYSIYAKKFYNVTISCLNIEISPIYLLLPLLILTYYCCLKTYVDVEIADPRIYNKKFNILFWVCALIQIVIYGIILIKSHIMLASDNILWQGLGIQIIIHYTLEEKLTYFHEYIEFLRQKLNMLDQDLNNIQVIIESYGLSNIVNEDTTIREIRLFILNLIKEYYEEQWNREKLNKAVLSWFNIGLTAIIAFDVIKAYYNAFKIVIQPQSLQTILFARKIIRFIYQFWRH